MTESSNNDERDSSRTFHPVHERGSDAWFPGDDGASLLITGEHIWEDICRIAKIRSKTKDPYDRKLLLKYVIVELRSLIQIMGRLQTLVMTAETYESGQTPLYRGISIEERVMACKLWKTFSEAKRSTERDLISVRNNLGAHRAFSDWQTVTRLWDKLDISLIAKLLDSIPPAFNHTKDLNIFEWNREPEPGVIEFLGGPVGPWLFEDGQSTSSVVQDAV